jgi:hypothetical protein
MSHPDPIARFLAAMVTEADAAADASVAEHRPEREAAEDTPADLALAELLSALPRPAPRAGFAARTALAAVTEDLVVHRAALVRRWRRAAVAVCLVATGLGLAALPLVLAAVRLALGRITLTGATAFTVRLTTVVVGELGNGLTDMLSIWQRLVPFERALAGALASPAAAAIAGLCLLTSALALRFLHDLVERERSFPHAHPSR